MILLKKEGIESGVSLVDFLAKEVDCVYVSDLTAMTAHQQKHLVTVLEKLPPEAASEAEWADALTYIEKIPAQDNAAEDRNRLLSALTGKRQGKHRTKETEIKEENR